MSLTDKEVLHVARLARLSLTREEVPKIQQELNEILGYFEKLQAIPTRGVVATSHVHGITNVFRDDVVKDSLPLAEVKKIAPDFVVSSFRVPKII